MCSLAYDDITLSDLIEILHKNIKGSHCAKNNYKFLQDMVNSGSSPTCLAISTTAFFNDLMIFSQTTASG